MAESMDLQMVLMFVKREIIRELAQKTSSGKSTR